MLPVKTYGVGFGALVEYEHPRDSAEARSLIAGPIVEAKSGPWSAIANVTFVHNFGGEPEETPGGLARDEKWDLAYAGQVKYEVSKTWAVALEAYGTFERIGNTGTPGTAAVLFGDHDQHRLGPMVYFAQGLGVPTVASRLGGGSDEDETEMASALLGVGVLLGLNDDTPDATLKWSVEVEF